MFWKEGFYDFPVDGGREITVERWRELLDNQTAGKIIVTDADGYPEAINPPGPTAEELRADEITRLKSLLAQTDWIATKCFEQGLQVAELYPELYAERNEWREMINALENSE